MPDQRALPVAAEHREFTVKTGGEALSREHHLLAAYVTKCANRIAAARLVFQDGAAASSDFPLSNSETFLPGTEVEILAGAADDPASLFTGVVVKQALKVREHTAPQLVVECRHKAIRLTGVEKSAYFFDGTDADAIGTILDAAGIEGDVPAMSVQHEQLLQYASTDWDFLLRRAAANGRLVFTNDAKVTLKAPSIGSASVTLQFGATVLELDTELDAREQYKAVKSFSWDPAQQTVAEADAADPGVAGPGNVSSDDLAGVIDAPHRVLTQGALPEAEAQAWADAEWLRSKLGKTTGRVKCQGIGTINPGDTVTLGGIGERFNGDVFVTAVRHDFDLVQGWKTHVQFGGIPDMTRERCACGGASALVPGVIGLQVGVVVSNEDPAGEYRVRVRMPLMSSDSDGAWARVAAMDAGSDRGWFIRPEVGDEVVLGFIHDDPRQAVILGMLHSSAKAAPLEGSDDNHEKVFQSRSKLKLYFNDDTKVMRFETPAGNSIALTEEDTAIKITDQNGNKIEMTSDGILIESASALELKAATELKLESGTSMSVQGGTDLKLEGASGAELSSTAITKVKGSMLQLN